jgi:hypothetical protein
MTWQQGMTPPPAAGGVNPTGPGQFAPPGPNGGIPIERGFQVGNLGREIKSGIGHAINPIGDFKNRGIGAAFDPAGLFVRSDPKKIKGSIDPATGTVDVSNYAKYQPGLEAAFTSYLRTGNVPPELKDLKGAAKGLKNQIKDLQATGWQWGTPSAGAPTVIPGQGPVNWGQQPGTGTGTPPATTPGTGTPPAAPWVKPPQLPSPAPYNPQAARADALRNPTGGGSKLVGGYGT